MEGGGSRVGSTSSMGINALDGHGEWSTGRGLGCAIQGDGLRSCKKPLMDTSGVMCNLWEWSSCVGSAKEKK